jgi:tRNA-Thr(GGU) m(6)t(6)A37 methyltransferase TsaA
LYWAHKTTAEGRALKQVHPMGRKEIPARGVFATCSPARPNPVLMSVVELLERRDNVLTVSKLDAIDQSPVLDIKPYVKNQFPQEGARTPDWMGKLMEEAKAMAG